MPRMSKADAPVALDEPEIEGRYAELGEYTVAFETHKADMDSGAPVPGPCRTIGASARTGAWYKSAGSSSATPITTRSSPPETAYYGAPGHLPLIFAGTELVEFSPTGPLNEMMGVVGKNLEAARAAGLAAGALTWTPARWTCSPGR